MTGHLAADLPPKTVPAVGLASTTGASAVATAVTATAARQLLSLLVPMSLPLSWVVVDAGKRRAAARWRTAPLGGSLHTSVARAPRRGSGSGGSARRASTCNCDPEERDHDQRNPPAAERNPQDDA